VRTRLEAFAIAGGFAGRDGRLLAYLDNTVAPGQLEVLTGIRAASCWPAVGGFRVACSGTLGGHRTSRQDSCSGLCCGTGASPNTVDSVMPLLLKPSVATRS